MISEHLYPIINKNITKNSNLFSSEGEAANTEYLTF